FVLSNRAGFKALKSKYLNSIMPLLSTQSRRFAQFALETTPGQRRAPSLEVTNLNTTIHSCHRTEPDCTSFRTGRSTDSGQKGFRYLVHRAEKWWLVGFAG